MTYAGPTINTSATGEAVGVNTIDVVLNSTPLHVGLVLVYSRGTGTSGLINSVTDNFSNKWTRAGSVSTTANRRTDIFWCNSSSSGNLTVTVAHSNVNDFRIDIFRMNQYIQLDTTSSFATTPAAASWYCADTGLIDTSAHSLIFANLAFSGSTGPNTDPSGFTTHASSLSTGNLYHVLYGEFESAQTDQRCNVTTSGTTRQTSGKIAAFTRALPPSIADHYYRMARNRA